MGIAPEAKILPVRVILEDRPGPRQGPRLPRWRAREGHPLGRRPRRRRHQPVPGRRQRVRPPRARRGRRRPVRAAQGRRRRRLGGQRRREGRPHLLPRRLPRRDRGDRRRPLRQPRRLLHPPLVRHRQRTRRRRRHRRPRPQLLRGLGHQRRRRLRLRRRRPRPRRPPRPEPAQIKKLLEHTARSARTAAATSSARGMVDPAAAIKAAAKLRPEGQQAAVRGYGERYFGPGPDAPQQDDGNAGWSPPLAGGTGGCRARGGACGAAGGPLQTARRPAALAEPGVSRPATAPRSGLAPPASRRLRLAAVGEHRHQVVAAARGDPADAVDVPQPGGAARQPAVLQRALGPVGGGRDSPVLAARIRPSAAQVRPGASFSVRVRPEHRAQQRELIARPWSGSAPTSAAAAAVCVSPSRCWPRRARLAADHLPQRGRRVVVAVLDHRGGVAPRAQAPVVLGLSSSAARMSTFTMLAVSKRSPYTRSRPVQHRDRDGARCHRPTARPAPVVRATELRRRTPRRCPGTRRVPSRRRYADRPAANKCRMPVSTTYAA